ncbi:type II toxin-antitoxin system HipA family toxin [Thioalkalivibrio sp. ALgr1]|uniref:type II toxin-antitoxin system HipA family toxin n=1 Tax=Thioalkalivibrio sp. ALgr1 TaxID=748655 RepID=UPI000361EF14|nr:type II toxin-antitoxin system HipA family toxin [Thioalkalivibrio sp. ALgr1]
MPRTRRHPPLRVLLNGRLVGFLEKSAAGAVRFQYDVSWLGWEHALPVSLSLPLREDAYHGAAVAAVFENLLPDADALRRRVAQRVGAAGTDAYSLLAAIGHDCVGALQFSLSDAQESEPAGGIRGEPLDDRGIEELLGGLAQAPLGLGDDDAFRISIAGAQEKTALLWHEGRWLKPHGSTPTTHILKPAIGQLPNGLDLSDSVENEFYCLRLLAAFGMPVARAEIGRFGGARALVVERFDRHWARDGRLLRLPQEDCCQALGVPPSRKYQSEGGPGLVDVLGLLRGSDTPGADQATVLKAQVLFWLIGATDGHAKNFSVFLQPGGGYRLTPLYDVLTILPSVASRQVERKQVRLALAVGRRNHYRVDGIQGRHFLQTGASARLPAAMVHEVLASVVLQAPSALDRVEYELPAGFPAGIHDAVRRSVEAGIQSLERVL